MQHGSFMLVPAVLDYFVLTLALLALAALFYIASRMLLAPAIRSYKKKRPPLQIGYQYKVLFYDHERMRKISLGQLHGEMSFPLHGIRDDHLFIKFQKNAGPHNYTISLEPGGIVFLGLPHSQRYERLKGLDSFHSAELIGHPASIRLAARMIDGKPLHYIDVELSMEHFLNAKGSKVMAFVLSLVNIVPPINLSALDKRGLYRFHTPKLEQNTIGRG